MSATYPHMCRDGHEEIGHKTDDEMCPVCKVQAVNAVLIEALTSCLSLVRGHAISKQVLEALALAEEP